MKQSGDTNAMKRPWLLTALPLGMCLLIPLRAQDRPNILWITSEDNGPHLGAYGDHYAETPNLDRLAARGLIYLNAWSNAPVCAPARTAIISGMYPTSLGAQHMRSMVAMPNGTKMYPQLLREAGYYCTNNSKEDYNLHKPGQVWDDSSRTAHWKNRRPGQPFFAIFNHTVTHESQIRSRPHALRHDSSQVRVPAYHPDTEEVRRDWAQYADKITEMDAAAGENLRELEQAGLAGDTIVFYYADHGPGMPRSKRWPYDSGLHVPLIVHIPERFSHLRPREYAPGAKIDRLVSFVDLAPTLLSLIGVKPPSYMQGHAFLGEFQESPRSTLHGFRGRMDERYDMVRTVRDQRYLYVRNYMPHKIYGQFIDYMFQTPTTQVWKRLFDEGKLAPPQTIFWGRKPAEELYDLRTDPDEVNNLADSPRHRQILRRLRRAQQEHAARIRDLGFLPEAEIHSRSAGRAPYEMGHDGQAYPLERIIAMAELASSSRVQLPQEVKAGLGARDSAVRYWAVTAILIRGQAAIDASRADLRRALEDESPSVRVIAAQALGHFGNQEDLEAALPVLLQAAVVDKQGLYVSLLALNALDELDQKAAGVADVIRALPTSAPDIDSRMSNYVPRLIQKILADLETG